MVFALNTVCQWKDHQMNMIPPRQPNGLPGLPEGGGFAAEDLIFSRTDAQGRLQGFNDTFLRISELSPSEAMGTPFRIVRHDDMPKAIFRLLWDRLKNGQPVGLYLRNRAKKDGSYWVFAIVVPNPEGGFVTVQIKPSSEHWEAMQEIYSLLRKQEKENGVAEEQSVTDMLRLLKDRGYGDYGQFEACALASELSKRGATLKRVVNPRLSLVQTLFDASRIVRQERTSVMGVLDTLRLLPTNMRLISHRIEKGHGPLSTLSERYGAMADSLLLQLSKLTRSEANSEAVETEALFGCGMELLLCEAARNFAGGIGKAWGDDMAEGQRALSDLAETVAARSQQQMVLIGRSAARLARELEVLQRSTLALDSIRVMSRVEFGQMIERSRDLANVIQRIDVSHKEIRGHLARLSAAVLQIEEVGGLLLRQLR